MLIIERRAGETVRIGEEVELRVLDTDGDTVRLGVSAPQDIAVVADGNARVAPHDRRPDERPGDTPPPAGDDGSGRHG